MGSALYGWRREFAVFVLNIDSDDGLCWLSFCFTRMRAHLSHNRVVAD